MNTARNLWFFIKARLLPHAGPVSGHTMSPGAATLRTIPPNDQRVIAENNGAPRNPFPERLMIASKDRVAVLHAIDDIISLMIGRMIRMGKAMNCQFYDNEAR
jgi:hypothetical protein